MVQSSDECAEITYEALLLQLLKKQERHLKAASIIKKLREIAAYPYVRQASGSSHRLLFFRQEAVKKVNRLLDSFHPTGEKEHITAHYLKICTRI